MKNFIRRAELPNRKIRFNLNNQILTEIAIDVLNANGVPVYEGTLGTGYDQKYPYLLWDHSQLIQVAESYSQHDLINCNSLEEFFSYFFESLVPIIKLTDEYSAEIQANKIKVGCQTISFEAVERVYVKMLELRDKK